MTLQFPRRPEVRLRNPPLTEVVCQVRFPPILRIAKEQPSEMQERVRKSFPHLEVEQGMLFSVPRIGSGGVPSAEPGPTTYRFLAGDRNTIVSLAQDFYALSTKSYQHWQDFASFLKLAHEAVIAVYEPSYATRIGLRYINRLTVANTKANDVEDMLQRIRPELTALLRTDAWDDPSEMRHRVSLSNGEARLTIQTGYGEEDGEPFFVIDFDYFEQGELPLESLVERCNGYHEVVYDAFRWCVPDDTLQAFGIVGEGS